MDGVLADTEAMHYRSWWQLGQEIGVSYTLADHDIGRGLSREACLHNFLQGARGQR